MTDITYPIQCFMIEDTGREETKELRSEDGTPYSRTSPIYRRVDTGEEGLLYDFPVGAMWFAPWNDDLFKPQLEHVLYVRTPGGDWCIDSQASNCTKPNKPIEGTTNRYNRYQEDHHCWIIHGIPPLVTVDKNGVTCNAGAGSIQQGSWHGFLRNGQLVL